MLQQPFFCDTRPKNLPFGSLKAGLTRQPATILALHPRHVISTKLKIAEQLRRQHV
jgi:hypothetical protein